ncbi:MAG TPA: HAMP domain-containing sensor histidine kinase [Candidatus Saccharimonadales bacterium]
MVNLFSMTASRLYSIFIEPHKSDADSRRREFILNTLLSGLLIIATVAFVLSTLGFLLWHVNPRLSSVIGTGLFWVAVVSLLTISRFGRPVVASGIFVALLLVSAVQLSVAWGFRLAQAELMFALTIVIIGVLFRASLALMGAVIAGTALLTVTFLQVNKIQIPDTAWEGQPFHYVDAIGYAVVFVIMGVVSWLSNRETDRSLRRARRSEAALQKERDNLESKVIERTHELEELQLARLLEMQPFAEFGRIGASLVHDIANPLTAANLHLEELNRQQHSELARQVQRNLYHLERYLIAARKQIKRESDLREFSVGSELRQVAHLLTHRARKIGVRLTVDKIPSLKLYGDVVKFNQLVANLLANALEASEKMKNPKEAEVHVQVRTEGKYVVIIVTDHGVGVDDENIDRLFEPFYSTKSSQRSGLGLGLALVKQYVEHDFKGTISVTSDTERGTVFTIKLKGQKRL